MNYFSVAQTAKKWNITPRRVQVLCNEGRIEGARRVGNVWTIPENAEKPTDARQKMPLPCEPFLPNSAIERIWAMPNNNPFEIKPIQDLIKEELTEGRWIAPFSNQNQFVSETNKVQLQWNLDHLTNVLDFMKMLEDNSVDGILYDPQGSSGQVGEKETAMIEDRTGSAKPAMILGYQKREIARIVKLGGKVISFGCSSGIGHKYGFTIKRILLVSHGGKHNDTICTVEIKTHEGEIPKIKKEPAPFFQNIPSRFTQEDKKLISLLSSLPRGYWDFKTADVKEYTHGLHNYPAMMVCPISRNIIKLVKEIKKVETVLDPFMGSGTVLVEGMLAGIDHVYGCDINPLALFLSKVKTTRLDITQLQQITQSLYTRIDAKYRQDSSLIDHADEAIRNVYHLDLTAKKGWGDEAPKYLRKYMEESEIQIEIPNFKNIGYWFKPRVILLLSLIKEEINKIPDNDMRDFVFVAFSETIRFVSNRRNGEFKMFRMPANKVENFEPNVIQDFTMILDRNIRKMNDFNEACTECEIQSTVSIFNNNAASLQDIPDHSIDLVVTSPPYGDSRTTVAYGEYSRLSLQWLDLFHLSEKEIMGIDKTLMGGQKYKNGFDYELSSDTLKKSLEKIKAVDLERAGDVYSFYLDLSKAIAAISKKTKPGGYQFWVVGNRTVKGELLYTDRIISEIAGDYQLEYIDTIDRNIINKVMPSLNSPSNESGIKSSTMTNEHIVVLRKK